MIEMAYPTPEEDFSKTKDNHLELVRGERAEQDKEFYNYIQELIDANLYGEEKDLRKQGKLYSAVNILKTYSYEKRPGDMDKLVENRFYVSINEIITSPHTTPLVRVGFSRNEYLETIFEKASQKPFKADHLSGLNHDMIFVGVVVTPRGQFGTATTTGNREIQFKLSEASLLHFGAYVKKAIENTRDIEKELETDEEL